MKKSRSQHWGENLKKQWFLLHSRVKSQSFPNRAHGYTNLYVDQCFQTDQGVHRDCVVGKDTHLATRENH